MNIDEFLVGLDQDHPGFRDDNYRAQRDLIAQLANQFVEARERGEKPEIPKIEYEQRQHDLWEHLYSTILSRYKKYAVSEVYEGLRALELNPKEIPTLEHVNQRLYPRTGFRVIPVSGLVSSKFFFSCLLNHEFYCTQYIRHHSKPDFTPEPDICHDVIGHVPLLMDPKISKCYVEFAHAAVKAEEEQVKELENLYWFTIEYGLCYQGDELRTYGAGNLSSYADIQRCVDPEQVEHLDFDIEKMCTTNYDPTIQQPKLFVAESMDFALAELSKYFRDVYEVQA